MRKQATPASGGRARGLLIYATLLLAPLTYLVVGFAADHGNPAYAREAGSRSRTHVVEIRQFKFLPAMIKAKPGDVIVWKNLDIAPHTATAEAWDSGNLVRNQSWSLKVTRKGTIEYICAYHPAMKGKIVVE
ncbi:cupredoxin family copper-binding protein [Erythrobacter sp. JK5]|uniref:cupredoxin domain-containing protein n=1 Tax=Erythrobacter sp. JK5 TaxID=2829500 RepID=UPI001BA8F69C|nr:cupredoxin family copper-binding protein [Erythrobacter sp. JK5]QUL36874.1 cupredoxin family copper-binding protein [Erythrobacter sp. JK5]